MSREPSGKMRPREKREGRPPQYADQENLRVGRSMDPSHLQIPSYMGCLLVDEPIFDGLRDIVQRLTDLLALLVRVNEAGDGEEACVREARGSVGSPH